MIWPFNHFSKSRSSPGRTIEAIYGTIVAQAREPLFYKHLDVPDTVDGRLDMLILHLWLVLRRLRGTANGQALSQGLFDHFCADIDGNLREMGVGDLTVPKRMRKVGEAFYGRTAAYDLAYAGGEAELSAALQKNILNGGHPDSAARLAAYAWRAAAAMDGLDEPGLVSADWRFPAPLHEDSTP